MNNNAYLEATYLSTYPPFQRFIRTHIGVVKSDVNLSVSKHAS